MTSKDPKVTFFNSISSSFNGIGMNIKLLDNNVEEDIAGKINNFPITFSRLLISTPDPTLSVIDGSYSDMDNVFTFAPNAVESINEEGGNIPAKASVILNELKVKNISIIATFYPPQSWINSNGSNAIVERRIIKGFANYILSGVLWLRSYNLPVDFVELFHEPDDESNMYGWMTPSDIVTLANDIKSAALLRTISPPVKLLAPGVSSVLGTNQQSDPYIQAFVTARNVIDGWSLHAKENILDISTASADTYVARNLFSEQLARNSAQMSGVNFSIPRYITSLDTIANHFKNDDGSTPTDVSRTTGYAIRIMEHLTNVMESGFSAAMIAPDKLFDDNNVALPLKNLLMYYANLLPIPNIVFISQEINKTMDKTVKSLVTTSNSDKFVFVLCRPSQPDGLLGKLRLIINNPLWNSTYEVKNMSIVPFPAAAVSSIDGNGNITSTSGVDMTQVKPVKFRFDTGKLTLDLEGLPYSSCVLFFTGDVSLRPIVLPAPSPTPTPTPSPTPGGGDAGTPVLTQTIIQVPVRYGSPSSTNYPEGTVYYDTSARVLKVFIGGVFINSTMMTYA